MATTIKIEDTLNWVKAFVVQRPTSGVGGVSLEPGLTSANKIAQTILAAPFRWPWNRKITDNLFTTSIGVTDYSVSISDWGYLEKATSFIAGDNPPTRELEIFQVLAKDTKQNPPQKIAPLLDDNAGGITFRILPAPDRAYQISVTYQKALTLYTGLTQSWAPIPDKYAFIYEAGMLAHMQGMYSIQAYALGMEMFFRMLVGAAEGLSETERAIFLEDQLRDLRTRLNIAAGAQQGRGVRV